MLNHGYTLALLACSLLGFLFPSQALAWPTKYASCSANGCHVNVEPIATVSVALDGTATTSITTTAGSTFEIDFIVRNIAGSGRTGLQISLPDVTWTLASGTANAPPLAGWNTAWNAAAGVGWATANGYDTSGAFPASPSGYTINFNGSGWDSGNRNAAYDDASAGDLDGTANTMGADARVTVPAGASGTYTIQLTGAGHLAGGGAKAYTTQAITVTISDTTPPAVSSTVPTSGATGVALNSAVTINWDENIDCTTVNTTNITINPNPGTWTRTSCSGSQAVFAPTGQANSTSYNVNVGTGVKDLAGNAMSAAYPFSYTTVAGNTPPAVPANPAQYQSNGTTIIAQGGYASSTTVVFEADLSDPDGNTVKLQIDYSGDSTSDCESALVASGSANIQVSCPGLTDGNSYDWQYRAVDSNGASSAWAAFNAATPDFRIDLTPPGVTSTVPANGATGVALNSQVSITFSENIDCATVNTTNVTSTSPGWSLNSCAGSTATFITSGQANNTSYSVNVTTAVKDPAGNALSAAHPFSYTTVAAGGDTTKPTVYAFSAIAAVNSNVNIPITGFIATDNVGVTGYMVTGSATPPAAGDGGWSATAPTTFTASAGDGTKTLYPWAKDAAGNISNAYGPVNVVVDSVGPTDGTLTVTAADAMNTLSWTAAADAGVGLRSSSRYVVRFVTGATPPADCSAGTSLYTGNNLTFTHIGLTNGTQYSYRVCAYDAANNSSAGATGSGTPALATIPTLYNTSVKWSASGVLSAKTTTATLGATINARGTSAITARGIVWSTTNTNPTIGGADVTVVPGTGTVLGIYWVNVTALPKATMIYFQGYATNASGSGYSGTTSFWTEPDTAGAPTVNAPSGTNYFDLTVNYTKPANADGVLVVARQGSALSKPPQDGTIYTANARFGLGDPTVPTFREYVVANAAANGSVTVTGLQDGTNYTFAVYAYKGTGTGISGVNYVQTIVAAGPVTTDSVPPSGLSHNEQYVATGPGGTESNADCANCHNRHHTAQPLLPTGLDMYDKCFVCHQPGGVAQAKANIGLHLSDGSVDCGTCHTMHSFRTEELYGADHSGVKGFNRSFVRTNMKKYFPVALEPTIFRAIPGDYAFAPGDTPYNAVCQTCHTDDARTPHHQQDATDGHHTGEDCMSCHSHKNTGTSDGFAPSGHNNTHFPWDATTQASCGTVGCHDFAANPDVVADVHGNICTICHTTSGGGDGTAKVGDATFGVDGSALLADPVNHTENCLVCHPAATYDHSTIHHNSRFGYAAAGNCTICHTGTNYPGDHSARVSLAANCGDCHDGTQGSASGIPVDATDATVAARKIHDACTTCHNTDGDATLKAPYGMAQAMPNGGAGSNNGGGSCEACHTAGFGGYHSTVGHATTVNTYVNCSTCHTGTAGLANSIPTSVLDNKVHDTCATCHGADGRLVGSATGKNGGTNGGSDAVNNCATCHGEYFSSHTNINHTTYVATGPATLICVDCHTATAGTTTTVPVSAADNKKHDACSTCHQATGVLKTFAMADTHNPDWITAMPAGGGNCTACHGASYFTSTHSSVHDSRFFYDTAGATNADKDVLQANGAGTGCAACHNDAAASLATFAAINTEHLNDCNKCHAETRDINESAASGTTVRQWIAAREAETTTDTNCRTCHVPNWTNAPNHAGHSATDFAWDATTQTTCGATNCHNYTVNTDVVVNVHGGTCTVCHSTAAGGDGTTILGSATNGVDGDARLGSTTPPHTDNCLVCHPDATYDRSTVHHASKNGYAAAGNCVQCHTGTTYGGNHTTLVSLAANCADCHNGGQGTTSGVPLDATDATVAARKLHDACTTCHNTDADGTLKAAYGWAQAMPNGGAGSNNGGGSCTACHTAGFGGYHATVGHATMVSTYVNCSTCHTATAGTGSGIPLDATDATRAARLVHDTCTTCHQANGRLVTVPTANGWATAMPNGGDNGGTNGGGNCSACHGEYFNSHSNINHTATVAVGGICNDCHTATAGTATTVPTNNTNNKVHDSCATCHQATGILVTFPTANGWTIAMPNGGTGGGTDGGGTCLTCHGDRFTAKTHSSAHDTKFYYDTTGTGANVDILQANGSAGCASCHNDAGANLATFAAINTEHTATSCDKCHKATRDINETTATGTTVRQWIKLRENEGSVTDTNCRTCHVPNWANNPNHAGHPTDFGKDAVCTRCHTGANVVADIHKGDCLICHSAAPPTRDNEKLGSATSGVDGDARLANGTAAAGTWASKTCLTCHPAATYPSRTIHHDRSEATSGNCIFCHMPRVGTQGNPIATRNAIAMPANLACNWCHLWWPNNPDYIDQATDNGYNTTTVPGKVMIYRLTWDPVTNQRQIATRTALTSHAISTNATTPINDYGACFDCHGATGSDNGRADTPGVADMVKPFHGVGQPVTSAVAVTTTGSNADFTRHVNNFFAGAQQTTSNGVEKTDPYHPAYAAFNWLAVQIGTNQGGGTKPYATDNNTYKFIHDSERAIRNQNYRNCNIGTTSFNAEWNNWGANKGSVGSVTVNTGGVEGSSVVNTTMPLVNLSLPTSINKDSTSGCP